MVTLLTSAPRFWTITTTFKDLNDGQHNLGYQTLRLFCVMRFLLLRAQGLDTSEKFSSPNPSLNCSPTS